MSEAQKEAAEVAEHLGFIRVASLTHAAKESHNKPQDLTVSEVLLGK